MRSTAEATRQYYDPTPHDPEGPRQWGRDEVAGGQIFGEPDPVPWSEPNFPRGCYTELDGGVERRATEVCLAGRELLLSPQEVYEQTDLDLGGLVAVVSLPGYGPEGTGIDGMGFDPGMHQVYIFDPNVGAGKHAQKMPYRIMGREDIARYVQMSKTGEGFEDIDVGVHPLTQRPGAAVPIGLDERDWVPNIGYKRGLLRQDPREGRAYAAINDHHAKICINDQYELVVRDLGSDNGTTVYYGPRTQDAPTAVFAAVR